MRVTTFENIFFINYIGRTLFHQDYTSQSQDIILVNIHIIKYKHPNQNTLNTTAALGASMREEIEEDDFSKTLAQSFHKFRQTPFLM